MVYAVISWDDSTSVLELDLDTLEDGVLQGRPVADCNDRDDAQRIARLLASDARDRAEQSTE